MNERTTDLLLIGVAAVWGASFLGAKTLAAEIGVPAAVALRFLIAVVAMAAICAAGRQRLPRGRSLVVAAVLGVSQAAIIGLETWGVHLTSATNAGLLISLALIGTPLLDSLATRRWLPRRFFVAATVAVVGVALLVSGDGFQLPNLGDLLVLAAAAVRAVHVTASSHLLRTSTDSTLGVVLVQMAVCTVAFTAISAPDLMQAVGSLSASGWWAAVFLGLACSVFAFVVQLWAVRRTSASRASILMGTEPVWAVLVGVVLAGDSFGPAAAVGTVLIIGACYAGQAIERTHRRGGAGTPAADDVVGSLPDAGTPSEVASGPRQG